MKKLDAGDTLTANKIHILCSITPNIDPCHKITNSPSAAALTIIPDQIDSSS